jgi:hypothetical protein
MSFNIHKAWQSNLGLLNLDKSDSINRLIPLSASTVHVLNKISVTFKMGIILEVLA